MNVTKILNLFVQYVAKQLITDQILKNIWLQHITSSWHIWIQNNGKLYNCPNKNCHRNYKTKPGLYNHLKYEFMPLLFNPKSGRMNKYPGPSSDGLFYCTNQCGKKYKSKQAISVHMRYECGVKPKFYCQECNKYFKQPVSFKAHQMNVHNLVI